METEKAIALFRELESRFRHPPHGGRKSQLSALFQRSQLDLYHLAQRLAPPAAQERLDALRRQVVQILLDQSGSKRSDHVIKPTKRANNLRWWEIILTPELEKDLAISYKKVPFALARDLQEAHRVQVQAVRRIVGT